MADSEIGDEVNIRIEVSNDFYHNDGEDERMEEDEPDVVISLNTQGADGFNNLSVTSHKEIEPQSIKFGAGPLGLEDGECSSNASSDDEMDVDSNGFMVDRPSSQSQRSGNDTQFVVQVSEPFVPRQPRRYPNPYLGEDMHKRACRAQRFGDTSFKYSPGAEELVKPTDEELLTLYISMGLINEDGGEQSLEKVNSAFRLDSILIRGLNNMSTDEIFKYLHQQGLSPKEMEWVNDACCVVIYKDKYEAAASLLKITKPIAVDMDLVEKKKSLLIEEKPLSDEGESHSRKSSISGSDKLSLLDYENSSVIPQEVVCVPMPLGHVWRFADPKSTNSKGILMRYAKTDDKKQERAEKHSEYYKKFGNPNNFNYRPDGNGRHKVNRKYKRARVESIEVESSSGEESGENKVPMNNKNAWSLLSASWGKEEKGRNKVQNRVRTPIPSRNFPPPSRKYSFQPSAGASRVSSIHERLGAKEQVSEDFHDTRKTSELERRHDNIKSREVTKRKRVWSDDEDDDRSIPDPDASVNDDQEEDEDGWESRLIGPRMKMHADDEESRQKLQAVRKISNQQSRRTVFGGSRLMTRAWDYEPPAERRPVKERLGVRRVSVSTYVPRNDDDEEEEESEDDNLDEQDLRFLLNHS